MKNKTTMIIGIVITVCMFIIQANTTDTLIPKIASGAFCVLAISCMLHLQSKTKVFDLKEGDVYKIGCLTADNPQMVVFHKRGEMLDSKNQLKYIWTTRFVKTKNHKLAEKFKEMEPDQEYKVTMENGKFVLRKLPPNTVN